jgi:hypothetical protein
MANNVFSLRGNDLMGRSIGQYRMRGIAVNRSMNKITI